MLKVVHLTPDFAANHLYNTQLIGSLRTLGVYLKTVRTKNFLIAVLLFRPQILHLHWLHSFIETDEDKANYFFSLKNIAWFIMQLAIVRACGIRIVWTVHELEIPETHYPDLDRLCIKLVTSLSSAIIAHCSNAQKTITNSYSCKSPEKVKVIPHGHFIEVIENKISSNHARLSLSIPETAFVILFFGLIRPYKGVIELIEAHKQLQRDDVLLLIVGGSILHHKECADYMVNIRQSINGRKNVRLIEEFIADERIQAYMNASDIVAFPYLEVMTSGALIMAMGFNKPCIASRVGCINETIDKRGAFLYEVTDKFGLLKSINTCLENTDKLKEMGEHNKRAVLNMNWNHIALETLSVYQSCY